MENEHPVCERCGRFLAEGLEEWDDSMELLCFGETDPLCGVSNPKMNNGKNLSLGETVWYDDVFGHAIKCSVVAVEPGRVWLQIVGSKERLHFEEWQLDRLRSTEIPK